MSNKIKIKWQGPGWYAGRYDENENIIVERVADYELTRAEAIERAGSQTGVNVVILSEPPAYMEVIEDALE